MKTLCKKLLTGCLALAMACAMAIPTFAAEPQTRANIYQSYAIQSQTQGINLHAEAYVNAPVYLATPATGWMLGRYGGTTKLYLTSTVGNSQLVIRYQGGNVLMANETFDDGDTAVQLPVYGGYHRIYFVNRGSYVNAINNGQVQTSCYSDSNAQLWILY